MRTQTLKSRLVQTTWWVAAGLSTAVALYSYRYLLGVGDLSPDILANRLAKPFLYVHIAGAATALLLGPVGLSGAVRRRWPAVHRWSGRTYTVGCIVGGVGGFFVAFGSTAGPVATVGFGSLAVGWIAATAAAWQYALQRRFDEHRRWILRSYAMTFAAVTLRLGLPVAPALGYAFVDGYRALSFLSWLGNLAVLEVYLRFGDDRRNRETQSVATAGMKGHWQAWGARHELEIGDNKLPT